MTDDPLERDFAGALEAVAGEDGVKGSGLLGHLSHPNADELALWRSQMNALPEERRAQIADTLTRAAEADFKLDFERLHRHLLDDPVAEVRASAIEGLWEAQDTALLDRFTAILTEDPAVIVRTRAAAALGTFVRREELGELAPGRTQNALRALLDTAIDETEDPDVRRRATESAGFADDSEVRWLLERLVASPEPTLVAGALRAMGNSADDRWTPTVIGWLEAEWPELRFEAARAAGELLAVVALPQLAQLALEDELEVRTEAIVALGEIGGTRAVEVLETLSQEETDLTLLETIEDALSSAALAAGEFELMDLASLLEEPDDESVEH